VRTGGWTLFFCDPQNLHDDSLGALTVELGVEDALPGSEVEAALRDRKGGLVVEEQGFEMGVGVVFAGLVVLVARPAWGEFLEPDADVLDEAVLVIVDIDGGGYVHGGDEAEAVVDAALADDVIDLGGDVDHLVALAGLEGQVLGVGFHSLRHVVPPLFSRKLLGIDSLAPDFTAHVFCQTVASRKGKAPAVPGLFFVCIQYSVSPVIDRRFGLEGLPICFVGVAESLAMSGS